MSYSTGGINLTITAEAQKSIDTLNKLNTTLKEVHASLGKIGGTGIKGIQSVDTETKKTVSSVNSLSTGFDKLGRTIRRAIGAISFTTAVKKSFREILDYTENFNLFSVAVGTENIKAGIKFQETITNSLGSSQTDTLRMQGFFMALSESLGIANKESYLLSENLTKLSYDLSSLYNVDANSMFSKLQSGLVGQTKPLRSVGIDVTQQTLQPYLKEMGIHAMVTELTQAEKVVLRYIAIIKQSSIAHGDMALTLQNPANQIRILTAQVRELFRWLGATFVGLLGKILPYINGFVMALVQAVKTIAQLFGFDVSQYDASGRQIDLGLDDEEESAGGIADNIGKAGKNAKELKKQLAGFDEINNLTNPKEPSVGGGGGVGGIGSTGGKYLDILMDNLKGYDNLMGSISNKATEIRDNIMDWLGFMKLVDPITGDVTWKLRDGETTLAKIWGWVKTIFIAFATFKIGSSLLNIMSFFAGLLTPKKAVVDIAVSTGLAQKALSWFMALPLGGKVLVTLAIVGVAVGVYKLLENLFKGEPLETKIEDVGEYAKKGVGKITAGMESIYVGKDYNYEEALKKYKEWEGNNYENLLANTWIDKNTWLPDGTILQERVQDFSVLEREVKNYWVSVQKGKDQKILEDFFKEHTGILDIITDYQTLATQTTIELAVMFGQQIVLTKDNTKKLNKTFGEMFGQIQAIYEDDKNTKLETYKQMLEDSTLYTREEKDLMIKAKSEEYSKRSSMLADFQVRTNQIMERAVEEKRSLTQSEYDELKQIQKDALNAMITQFETTSETEMALRKILSAEALQIDKNTGMNIYSNAVETRNKQIELIKSEHAEKLERLKTHEADVLKEANLSKEEYLKLIGEQYNGALLEADEGFSGILSLLAENIDDFEMWSKDVGIEIYKTESGLYAIRTAGATISDSLTAGFGGIKNALSQSKKEVEDFNNALKNIKSRVDVDLRMNTSGNSTYAAKYGANAQGGTVTISARANGGLVNSAELFFANENGNPEYIGKFGNKGAVANNDQIVDGISKGVYNAITEANKNNGSNQPMNITVPVNIGGTTVGTQLIRYLKKTQEETGEYILALD